MKRAISLLSAVIFIGFTISVTALVYRTGMPIVEKMQASAAVERMKSNFISLDGLIQRVASEVNGSRRTMSFRIDPGNLMVDPSNDAVYWVLDTAAPIFSPRSASYYGNLVFGSNLETSAYDDDYMGIPCFVLENAHLTVYIRKIGSEGSPEAYGTRDMLVAVYQKDLGQWADMTAEILVDGGSASGTGYSELERYGNALPYGKVTVYMYSELDYSVDLILESGADFLVVEGSIT